MNARALLERAAGRSVAERLGFLLVVVCLPTLAYQVANETGYFPDFVRHFAGAVAFGDHYSYESMRWPRRGLWLGLFLRFAWGPLVRWLKAGERK